MTEQDVLRFLDLCEEVGLDIIVDGGWGVDALLERQTRRHRDLDIALPMEDVPRIRAATDLGNIPMANAFRRAGYINFERTINMIWH